MATCGVLLRDFVERVQSGIAIGVFACYSAIFFFVGKKVEFRVKIFPFVFRVEFEEAYNEVCGVEQACSRKR